MPTLSIKTKIILSWFVHLLTASGLIIGFIALDFIANASLINGLLLLMLTIIIDSIDGPLARYLHIKKYASQLDGTLLDNIVDFFTWVIIPCYFLIAAKMIPADLEYPIISAILLSAAYQFCCSDVKSQISTFKRWPSAWSITIIFMFLWQATPWQNIAVICVFVILSLIPIYYIHPFQKCQLFTSKLFATGFKIVSVIYIASMLISLYLYPNIPNYLNLMQKFGLLIYFLLCFYQTWLVFKNTKT